MKLCKDCRNFIPSQFGPECGRDHYETIDLVTGKVVFSGPTYLASLERENRLMNWVFSLGNVCGPKGKFWDSK